MDADEDHSALVANFLAITDADEAAAHSMLAATDWNLEQAVNLFFTMGDVGGGGDGGGGAAAGGADVGFGLLNDVDDPLDTEWAAARPQAAAVASGGGGGAAAGAGGVVDDAEVDGPLSVRAPLPARTDRLYDDSASGLDPRLFGHLVDHQQHMAAMEGHPARVGRGARGASAAPTHAFRDFKAQTNPGGRGGVGGTSTAGRGGGDSSSGSALGAMYRAPAELLFAGGNFEAAKLSALQAGRWVLLNLQNEDEFASHRLNRDTWSNPGLRDVVQANFVFYQQFHREGDGPKLVAAYHLHVLPAILVIDPITGAQLLLKGGFQDPENLLEELLPFMECGPKDRGAGALAQQMTQKRKHFHQQAAASGAATGGGPARDDDQLRRAIAASLGNNNDNDGEAANDDDDDGMDEEQMWERIRQQEQQEAAERAALTAAVPTVAASATPAAVAASVRPSISSAAAASAAPLPAQKVPQDVQAEAAARVPPEPAAGVPSVRVALRLPDGSRVPRSFASSDTVQVLHDFVISRCLEAASGQAFVVVPAHPGGAALTDLSQTLSAANVDGAMLAVRLG